MDRCHRVRQRLAPTQWSQGTKEYPTWATRLGQEFQGEVVMVTGCILYSQAKPEVNGVFIRP